MSLKTIQDWDIRFDLQSIPGISEVTSWGGFTKEYTVEVDPLTLQHYGLTVHDVVQQVSANNSNFGGGFIEHNEEEYTIRGLGRTESIGDLSRIVIKSHSGVPVLLSNVAKIVERRYPRQGAVMHDGKGETVSGMVILVKGTNGNEMIKTIKRRIAQLKLQKMQSGSCRSTTRAQSSTRPPTR